MQRRLSRISRFLAWSSKVAGRPSVFIAALILVALWIVGGLIWGFTDWWLLIMNTIATLNASLMVLIIQNTQYRENKALHLKIDELIRATKEAENELIAIEEMEEDELEKIRKEISRKTRPREKG